MIDKSSLTTRDKIIMSVPNKPEYVSVLRLTTSALANKIGFNVEEIDDIKVAIAEACTFILQEKVSNESFNIEFHLFDSKMAILVKGNNSNAKLNESKENGLGLFIIKSLMDEVEFVEENDCIEIIMTKEIEDVVK